MLEREYVVSYPMTEMSRRHRATGNGHSSSSQNGVFQDSNAKGSSSLPVDTDGGEGNGHATRATKFRRRRKGSRKSILDVVRHRIRLEMKRNPTILIVLASAILLLGLIVCLAIALRFHHVGPDPVDVPLAYISLDNKPLLQHPKSIIFQSAPSSNNEASFFAPPTRIEEEHTGTPDYGGLSFKLLLEEGARREIYIQPEPEIEESPKASGSDSEENSEKSSWDDAYYAFDDDIERGYGYDKDGNDDPKKICRRVSEHRFTAQNCNSVHELNLVESHVKYLAEGAYRQVFSMELANSNEKIAMKDLSTSNKPETDSFEFVRMDAMVAEKLSSSPRTFDIYGFCALSILSEFFYYGDAEQLAYPTDRNKYVRRKTDPLVRNHLTAIQKLVLGLEMAEGLAELHGYKNGLIVHNDVQPSQYLLNKDKSILKFNDFNRAEFVLWDDKEQEYCKYKNGRVHGNWRSPEEYVDGLLDEKVDIWSLGNNLYGLLTGLQPLCDLPSSKFAENIVAGEISVIDPRFKERSIAEKYLAEVIQDCFKYEPSDRPTIFEVVSRLREGVSASLGMFETRKSVLQSINTEH